MLRKIFDHVRRSRLAQAGAVLVVLGGTAEALDQLQAVDLSSVPYVGHYAPTIVASAGVLKIVVRLSMALLAGLAGDGK